MRRPAALIRTEAAPKPLLPDKPRGPKRAEIARNRRISRVYGEWHLVWHLPPRFPSHAPRSLPDRGVRCDDAGLFGNGTKYQQNCAHCPVTTLVMEQIAPAIELAAVGGGETLFSTLRPGTCAAPPFDTTLVEEM